MHMSMPMSSPLKVRVCVCVCISQLALLNPIQNPDLELAIVMLIVPFFVNVSLLSVLFIHIVFTAHMMSSWVFLRSVIGHLCCSCITILCPLFCVILKIKFSSLRPTYAKNIFFYFFY